MSTIKTLDTRIEAIITELSGIASYQYGFREDYNDIRDRTKFPKLIFRVMDDAPLNTKIMSSDEGQWFRYTCKSYLMRIYNQNELDTISAIHSDIDQIMNEVFNQLHSTDYRIVKGKSTYYDKFENKNLAGVGYDFTVDMFKCPD